MNGSFPRGSHGEPRSLYVEHFQQRIVILIEQDWGASLRAQFHRSAYVVDVGVGDDYLFYYQVVLADDGENILNIVARIDDHGFARGLIADDGAVTLQRANGKDLVDHRAIVERGGQKAEGRLVAEHFYSLDPVLVPNGLGYTKRRLQCRE